MPDSISTARMIGQYRRELIAEGLSDEQADRIVFDYATQQHRETFLVLAGTESDK